ncbi:hypothetical protein OR1_01405 [Geobacter sp. OR-1]|uniref:hypothetical protein n=1 Tax=Geobacter sp. OR-1 TaxID=1266765 RepID=UPI0005436CEA|nr:hypothetical protein [Geobacter sp. OR-1]GAM09131.1 hypothetical protein OR1_01405 [Geobacter sp. OR-1]
MTINNLTQTFNLLDSIRTTCNEIQQALNEHFEKTSIQQYKSDIEKDLVTIENLKHITIAVKDDIQSDKVGASTELLLRVAANDFKNKLNMIPEKKALIKQVLHSLKEIHRQILHYSLKAK